MRASLRGGFGNKMEQLTALFKSYGANKTPLHGGLYDSLFSKYRRESITLLEIGISHGGSLRAWCDYFSIATILGIDKNAPAPSNMPVIGRATALIGNVLDAVFMQGVIDTYMSFDIIIDDGAHTAETQQKALEILLPVCKKAYIIEDLHAMDRKEKIENGFVNTIDHIMHLQPTFFRCHDCDYDIALIRGSKNDSII